MARYGAIASELVVHNGSHVLVTTTPCVVCNKQHQFTLNRTAYEAWQTDTHIQNAFPEFSVADREILISGTCDECFNKLFPPEEDE